MLEGHGAIRVETLDEADRGEIEARDPHGIAGRPQYWRAQSLGRLSRNPPRRGRAGTGLNFPELAPDVEARLSALLSVGASAGNPADGGFTVLTSVAKYVDCVDILCDDAGLDLLILQAELPREEGMAASWEERFQRIHDLVAARGKKLAFISMFSRMLTDYSRAVRARLPKVAFVQETRKSLRALDHLVTWSQGLRAAGGNFDGADPAPAAHSRTALVAQELRRRALAAERRLVLDERESKALLAAYGIAGAKEMIAVSVEEAVAAADAIGYPVVVKALSEQLLHKSDAGGVILDIANEDSVRSACRQIAATVEERAKIRIESFLVCEQVKGSVELALGLDRDPEMGLLMMVGSGGLLLELIEDVAFAAPPVTVESARGLIDKLKIAKILRGYRGAPAHDIEKIADAIAGLGRLAIDLADVIESLDVNPLVSRPGVRAPRTRRGGGAEAFGPAQDLSGALRWPRSREASPTTRSPLANVRLVRDARSPKPITASS